MNLEVKNVHSMYGEAHVLHGVDMDVRQGEAVVVLGRNGMGKTTLIRSIMGLTPPVVRQGEIHWNKENITRLPSNQIARKGIAIVPQGRRLFASLTVTEHLSVLKPARIRSGWTQERIFTLFPRLAERRRHYGNQLSGGERQMLAVARALVTDPQLILMDEPSEGLAPVMVQHLERIIMDIKQSGLSILLVEQNVFSALSVADRVYVIESGRIVFEGDGDSVRTTPELATKFLGVS